MNIASWPGALSGNPFLEMLFEALKSLGHNVIPVERPSDGVVPDADVLLIQWPDRIFWKDPGYASLSLSAKAEIKALWEWRKAGKKLVWIVHNNIPHDLNYEQKQLWRCYSAGISILVHGFMTLSPKTRRPVLRNHPLLWLKPHEVFRHPAYLDVKRSPSQRVNYRHRLNLSESAFVIGFLGRIRPYKGVPQLISAFKETRDENLRLIVSGQVSNGETQRAIERAVAGDNRILLSTDLLSDEDYALSVAACDALVAPYREYLHSGTLLYGASASRRTLTPRTPFSEDLAECVGEGWLTLYDGALTSQTLQNFVAAPSPVADPQLDRFDVHNAAQSISGFCRRILGVRRKHTKSRENEVHDFGN